MLKGDKVQVISGEYIDEIGYVESGHVNHCSGNIYFLVRLNNGLLVKCLDSEVELLPDEAPNTITLTREDFENAVKAVLTPSLYKDDIRDYGMITAVCLSGELVCKKLAEELFGTNG